MLRDKDITDGSGGVVGVVWCLVTMQGKTDVLTVCNSILAGLVSVMAGCANITNLESILTGAVGGLLATLGHQTTVSQNRNHKPLLTNIYF